MTRLPDSFVRQLGLRDHLRFPDLARIGACLDGWKDRERPALDDLLDSLGTYAPQVTIVAPQEDGDFLFRHFGAEVAADAGFDMTGQSTAAFDPQTRVHLDASFRAVLQAGHPLCTILPGAPGAAVNSWQRVIYPVALDTGPHVLSVVRPLHKAIDAVHARPNDVAVCVVPLRVDETTNRYGLAAREPVDAYLGHQDWDGIDAFVAAVAIPDQRPPIGTLIATQSLSIASTCGKQTHVLIDMVHGFTTPFLVIVDASTAAETSDTLRNTEHLLKSSFKVGKLGSWTSLGRDAPQLQLADELMDMFDLQADENGLVAVDAIRSLYDEELRAQVVSAMHTCWADGTDYILEGGLTRKDGVRMHVRIFGSAMRDVSKRIIGVFGLIQDISDDHASRMRLQESEQRFRDFASSAGDWCWETDAEHRFMDFTVGTDELGLELRNEFVGKTRRDIPIVEEDRPVIEAHFQDLDARREIKDLTYRFRSTRNGRLITIQASGRPRFAPDGTFLGYRGTARNITDLVEAAHLKREHELALEDAQSIAKLGYWTTELATHRTRWSCELLDLLGLEHGACCGGVEAVDHPSWRQVLRQVHRDDRSTIANALRQASSGAIVEPFDVRFFHPGSLEPRHFRITMRLKPGALGVPTELTGVAQDVGDLKRTQAELETRTQRLSEAQEMGRIGDWHYGMAAHALTWSKHLYELLGLSPESFDVTPDAAMALVAPEDRRALEAAIDCARQGKPAASVDVQSRRGDGTFGYYTILTKCVYDAHGSISGLFGTVQDITDRKRAEKQLHSLAYYDPLTGLANRALFSREMDDVLRGIRLRGGSAALLLLDLDNFKEVNDTLGHPAGDELLRTVGRLLKPFASDKGFVARLGGDEFAIIIRDYASIACLEQFADSVVKKLHGVLKLQRGEVMTGTSLGVALIPQDGGNAEEALRSADLALYMAKGEGRGKALFFRPEMSRAAQARIHLARDLRTAIEKDALETRYQGQVDLRTNQVVGFETLVRWKHPERGYISPADFIPVAESSNLICDIGLWVLRDACRTGRAWLDAGEPERVISVNVSTAQIWQSNFEEDVMAVVRETGYPPHLLCLELTESVFADHGEDRVRHALARFKEAGIRLAVDDFGTGYSSLGYLNELPFDELKIDRCFVSGIHTAPDKARVLQGIVALGRGLGMSVIAEGAEEDGELGLLRAFGCDIVQGFVYLRPERADDALRAAEALEFKLAEAHAKIAPSAIAPSSGDVLRHTG